MGTKEENVTKRTDVFNKGGVLGGGGETLRVNPELRQVRGENVNQAHRGGEALVRQLRFKLRLFHRESRNLSGEMGAELAGGNPSEGRGAIAATVRGNDRQGSRLQHTSWTYAARSSAASKDTSSVS